MTFKNVKFNVSERKRRLKMSLVQFLSNGTAKTKLAILIFLYCGDLEKNSNARNGSSNHPRNRNN